MYDPAGPVIAKLVKVAIPADPEAIRVPPSDEPAEPALSAAVTIAPDEDPVVTILFPESSIFIIGCVVNALPDIAPSAEPAKRLVAGPTATVAVEVATASDPAE